MMRFWNRLSLLHRLSVALTSWVVIGFLAGYLILSNAVAVYVKDQFDEELLVHVTELRRLTEDGPGGSLVLNGRYSDPRYEELDSGYYWQVRLNDEPALYSPSLAGRNFAIPEDDLATNSIPHRHEVTGPTGALLIMENVVVVSAEKQLRFIVGMDRSLLNAQLGEFNRILGLSLMVLAISLVCAGYLLVNLGLSPLEALTSRLRKLRAGELQILEGDYPSEIAPIVDELNGLVQSGRENLQKARGQAGRLAHGLRTPLAVVSDEAYRLEELGQSEAAKTIAEQCRAMQIQIDQHIARSRASAMSRLPGVKCNVLSVAGDVLKALSRLHTDRNIEADVDIAADLEIQIDATDFGEVLGCVLDNAFKHARQRLLVSAERLGAQQIAIHVDDDGDGIVPESREYVFQTGVRLAPEVRGSGLGLSIVREIVELYGGSCHFEDSDMGGARFTIICSRTT